MKRGKREKVKNPTLQSYILSLLSLVLCCAMFMSATMAWFTSEVTTTGNQIYVGTLDVDLRDADNETLHGKSGVLFDQVLLPSVSVASVADESEDEPVALQVNHWQDGAIALEPLQVVNEGDLAFQYELTLVLSTEQEADTASEETAQEEIQKEDLTAVTDQFEVWVLSGELLQSGEYVDVTDENSDWTKVTVTTTDAEGNESTVDTLTAILESGTPIFTGTITAEEIVAKKETAHKYTVALRMKDTSAILVEVDEDGNETTVSIMGKSLFLSAKLVASQLIAEQTGDQQSADGQSLDEQNAGDGEETTP